MSEGAVVKHHNTLPVACEPNATFAVREHLVDVICRQPFLLAKAIHDQLAIVSRDSCCAVQSCQPNFILAACYAENVTIAKPRADVFNSLSSWVDAYSSFTVEATPQITCIIDIETDDLSLLVP